MGRSARARKRQESRSGDGITTGTVRGAPRASSPTGLASQASNAGAQLSTPSSPSSSSEALSEIVAEIVVWTDDMEPAAAAGGGESGNEPSVAGPAPFDGADGDDRPVAAPSPFNGEGGDGMPVAAPEPPAVESSQTNQQDAEPRQSRENVDSSLSTLSEHSDLSSVPSIVSSRATTPVDKKESARESPRISDEQLPALPPSKSPSPVLDTPAAAPEPAAAPSTLQVPQQSSSLTDLSTTSPIPVSTTPSRSPAPAAPVSSAPTPSDISTSPLPRRSPQKRSSASTPADSSDYQEAPKRKSNVRPKSSIPSDISPAEYASQCIEAAENSRLNPFILHPQEHEILREHLSYVQVTTYLNIRNGILRLWIQNPRVAVTRDEAVGCAGARWANVASVSYDWLIRNGFINFGCLDFPVVESSGAESELHKQKTIVVIGAGMAGLGCARQLEGLSKQYSDRLGEMGEPPPKVIVLEGRSRVGGRVYSRPFQTQPTEKPQFAGGRCTAEMGGMIITGFIGNPLNILVRGQLSLPYLALNPRTTIFDSDGQPVEEDRDLLVEKLYNDCLDRVSEYKFKSKPPKVAQGNRDLIMEGRDANNDGYKTIRIEEDTLPALTPEALAQTGTQSKAKVTAAQAARSMGWSLRDGASSDDGLDLETPTSAPGATLGSVVDSCISQYQKIVDLTDRDFRLLNWHIANLEYSNATNMANLSLGGWDIDAGNEWIGKHTMIAGGYQRVARGLLHCPTKLDVRTNTAVRAVNYHADESSGPATIVCEDGSTVEADYVVSTIPLGVLKHRDIEFNPPLPDWKEGAIERLGFGVLNKVILVYKEPFWDLTRHIFGALRSPADARSLDQSDYRSLRGRFYQFLDVSNTSGLPCLVALMAGDAALDTETASNEELVAEATELLRKIFGEGVPPPIEATVARWERDRFARGSYSSSGPEMQPTDYDTMARRVGNLYFAGEHTIGTHPATVHGAYLSGLRAAGEILHSLVGDVEVPSPLLIPRDSQPLKRKVIEVPKDPRELYEDALRDHIISQVGPRPAPPEKVSVNAYRLYCVAKQDEARGRCQADIRPGKRKGRAGPNEVRHMVSKMWRQAAAEERGPFEEMVAEAKRGYGERLGEWEVRAGEWDAKAGGVRGEYVREHPFEDDGEGESEEAGEPLFKQRRTKMVSYAESEGSGGE